MTAADVAGSTSTNTPGLNGLTKDVGDAIVDEAGCAVSTRYPMAPLPRLQGTDTAPMCCKPVELFIILVMMVLSAITSLTVVTRYQHLD